MKAVENIITGISTLLTAACMLIALMPLVTGETSQCGMPLSGGCAGILIF